MSGEQLIERTLALCHLAKAERLAVTPAKVLDVLRALPAIDYLNAEDYRLAVRMNLASSADEERRFDRLFREFFYGESDERHFHSRIRGESMQGSMGHHYREINQEITTAADSYSADEVTCGLDLQSRWDPAAPPLDQLIRELAKHLATRRSRRLQRAKHGAKVDLRRSVRGNIRYGMDLVDLARVERRTRKTRLVMLCDVSGSMDAFNPFLLRLMFGLQQALKNSRTLVFSTHVTEITSLLRRRSVVETLSEVGETVRHWSGGTNIGGALATLNRGVLREGSAGSTVAIIISDGYDNGETRLIELEMQALQRQVRTVVWINPMYGASTFQVRASGMKAALPYIDHFLPAFDVQSLRILVRDLAKI
ncbi:MAG: VWA domain-containing protein [Gammaproteobacteria bacterium]|nr:VWA domain-containing protein [Gammaproteobacteria bacterium]